MQNNIQHIKDYLVKLQNTICENFRLEDPQVAMQEDNWQRPQGGGGSTRSLSGGSVIEKAGVNFSHIWGDALPAASSSHRHEIAGCKFQALGVSVIVHPLNPYVPTCHANLRFFMAEKPDQKQLWWFGGGFDLTPYYGFNEDCVHWHKIAKKSCDPFGKDVYDRFKKWADDYFFIKHRNEPRGIGGLFFDDVNEWGFDTSFLFLQSVGNHFLEAYLPILQRRKNIPFGEREREFQCYRRGRYVEFNLVYDRGTLFGLQSGGRIESILISLPSHVSWKYDWQPQPGSQEDKLYKEFLVPKNWVNQ